MDKINNKILNQEIEKAKHKKINIYFFKKKSDT